MYIYLEIGEIGNVRLYSWRIRHLQEAFTTVVQVIQTLPSFLIVEKNFVAKYRHILLRYSYC
jgi:hypothetical protein